MSMFYSARKIFVVSFFFFLSAAAKERGYSPTVQFVDSTYIVIASFKTTLPDEQLLEIFYSLNHITKYLGKINLSLKLIEEKKDYNKIQYTYYYLVSKLILTFDRQLNRQENIVSFQLNNCIRSNKIVPLVTRATGYYKIVHDQEGKRVLFYQKTSLDKSLNKLYCFIIKKTTIHFLVEFKKYISEQQKQWSK